MLNINSHQPEPQRKDGAAWVWPQVWADVERIDTVYPTRHLVLADMKDRDRIGWERHGGPLVVGDGRNPLIDMYQEILDGAVYAKNAMMEGLGDGRTLAEIYAGLIEQAFAVRWMILQQTGE